MCRQLVWSSKKKSRAGHDFMTRTFGEEENRDAEQNHPQNGEGGDAAGGVDNGVAEEEHGRNDKEGRDHGIQGNPERRMIAGPAAENENSADRQGIEGHDRGNEGVGELLERPGEDEDHANGRAEPDRDARGLEFPIDDRNRLEEQTVRGHREEDPRAGHHRSVERSECRYHHGNRDKGHAGCPHQSVGDIGRDELRVPDLVNGEHGQIRQIRQQIQPDDYQRAEDENARKISFRVLYLPADEANVGPAIVDPEHRHKREPEASEGEASRRNRGREVTGRLRQSDHESEDNDEEQRPCFGQRRDVLHQRPPLDADIVERRREEDRSGRDVMNVAAVRRDPRVMAEDPKQVFRKSRGGGAKRCSANHEELGPAEEKSGQPSPRLANEDVHPAGAWEYARYFGERQRPAEGEETAGHPDREERKRTGKFVRYSGGRAKDSRADRRADENRDCAPHSEPAWKR